MLRCVINKKNFIIFFIKLEIKTSELLITRYLVKAYFLQFTRVGPMVDKPISLNWYIFCSTLDRTNSHNGPHRSYPTRSCGISRTPALGKKRVSPRPNYKLAGSEFESSSQKCNFSRSCSITGAALRLGGEPPVQSRRIIFSIPRASAVAAYNISRHINIPVGGHCCWCRCCTNFRCSRTFITRHCAGISLFTRLMYRVTRTELGIIFRPNC